MSDSPYPLHIKLVLVGDSGVGKSCCLSRFSEPQNDSVERHFTPTVGVDFKMRIIEIGGKRISIQIWDTAGQEKFRSITPAFYRGAVGVILFYDVTNERSFHNIRDWISSIRAHVGDYPKKILIGNKSDLTESRVVSFKQGQELGKELEIPFFEVSAKENINVEEAFYAHILNIKADIDQSTGDQTSIPGGNKGQQDILERHHYEKRCC